MYGSNFCSRTVSPRCSSSMPMEARGQPLAERTDHAAGHEDVLGHRATVLAGGWLSRLSYITRRAANNLRRSPARAGGVTRRGASRRPPPSRHAPHERGVIGRRVHPAVGAGHDARPRSCRRCRGRAVVPAFPIRSSGCGGRRRELQQEVAAVGVHAEVLEEAGGPGGEVRLAVADHRDRAAAEVQRPAAVVAHHLHARSG